MRKPLLTQNHRFEGAEKTEKSHKGNWKRSDWRGRLGLMSGVLWYKEAFADAKPSDFEGAQKLGNRIGGTRNTGVMIMKRAGFTMKPLLAQSPAI